MTTAVAVSDLPILEEHETEKSWLEARQTGVGASESGVLLGVSTFKTPYQMWAERVGLVERDASEAEHLKWGKRLQDAILWGYADETGRSVRPVRHALYRDPVRPWLLASPDGFVQEGGRDVAVIEAKNVSEWKKDEWDEAPPDLYLIQTEHQMLVTRAEYAVLAALIGGNRLRHVDVQPNLRLREVIVTAVEAFWQRVQREDPPPVDGSEATKRILYKAFGRPEEGKYISLPGAAMEWDREWLQVDAALKSAKKKKDEVENLLRGEIGSAWGGVLPDGTKWNNTPVDQPERTTHYPANSYRLLTRSKPKQTKNGR